LLWFTTILGFCGHALALSTATITVNGQESTGDSSTVTVVFNGFVETVHYGQYSSAASVASAFGAMFSRDYLPAGLCAHAVGNVITFQLRGAATFGAVDITGSTSSFTLSPTGFLSSGSGVADTGRVVLSVNGAVIASTDYGAESTPETVADGLAESASSSLVSVTAIGNTLRIDAATPGSASNNISYSVQNASYNNTAFSNPSFPSSPISGNLQGGADAGAGNGSTVYQYSAGYDAVGNVTSYNDSAMGAWSFGYDTLNRLTSGAPGAGSTLTNGMNLCWSYDAFGNRTAQDLLTSACPTQETSLTPTASYNANNQVTFVANVAPAGYAYDAAGDVANDNVNQYLYDGNGRICAVANTPVPGMTTMTGYIYDADGSRVAKGSITAWSCDPSINGFEPNTEHDYILGPSGEQVTEMAAGSNGMVWQHTNVWAGGKLIATYDTTGKGLHFHLNDPLGTRRAQTDYAGNWEQNCLSLPYGDALTCSDSVENPTEQHFTGQIHDSESGNDYFGYRYLSASLGRWTSPDPSGLFFADAANPQGFNLYAYVQNNPLAFVDPNGLGQVEPDATVGWQIAFWQNVGNFFRNFFSGFGDGSNGGSGSGAGSGPSTFQQLWQNYPRYSQYPSERNGSPYSGPGSFWQHVGGHQEMNASTFVNSCALRMCYALNRSGVPIPFAQGRVSDASHMWGIPRLTDLQPFLIKNFGQPEHYAPNSWRGELAGRSGILMFQVNVWSDASGHAELWNGSDLVNGPEHDYTNLSSGVLFWPIQ
jgi:RHS repeat-associated protein